MGETHVAKRYGCPDFFTDRQGNWGAPCVRGEAPDPLLGGFVVDNRPFLPPAFFSF